MNDGYRDVLGHVEPADVRALLRTYKTAQAAAHALTTALTAVIPCAGVSVVATVQSDGRAAVLVTLTGPAVAAILTGATLDSEQTRKAA